ncbi:alternative ribosome rescue aminoacyl-tRNA hydrolase ArfB [Altibacter sp. HG106]|uniref:alternative ribosome rescue aminoacyl-tRNA hydrolase ArfB n=1 Tax=Altibacter sp. HG106 TaxID=3023937 RepID=UPI002350C13F|nr:alternative ribosome rescue aminoacyl-tRNA hydrolase ArfB [Altibacter sp. HG106]MDC7995224.1 alternative ribosome rescue aminoacyl-tRNA hydrolase ArfB [Altibacter sp. HG106]
MNTAQLHTELSYRAMRSSGPGGQHANKTSSKVAVHFNVETSKAFSEEEKERLQAKLENRLTKDGELILSCDTYRSQHKNKALVTERLVELLQQSLRKRKKRKKTKPSKRAIEKRLRNKKKQALKKRDRRPPPTE